MAEASAMPEKTNGQCNSAKESVDKFRTIIIRIKSWQLFTLNLETKMLLKLTNGPEQGLNFYSESILDDLSFIIIAQKKKLFIIKE